MYRYVYDTTNTIIDGIIQRISDSAYIPFDDRNNSYQAYLEWLENGNTPEERNLEEVE